MKLKLKYSVVAVALACAAGGNDWADDEAEMMWVDSEFELF